MPDNLHQSSKAYKHAAIMFTDIVGYTALMGKDENKALEVLARNKETHTQVIGQFNGTLIKEMGDGMLVCFHIATDAVRCAIEIQKACVEKDIPLKIGIHEAEVLFVGSDVLGDGVNLASRIQDSTTSGCITISESVYRNVRNKSGINTISLGERTFKNVDDPIKIYSIVTDKTPGKTEAEPDHSKKTEMKSIIVLPFENISSDPEQEYFSDGLTEEIITDLSYIHDLLVISRSSAMTFKGSKQTIKEIAQKVNVTHVLEGSVRKAGNKLRITAQLIEAKSDTHIWAEKYNGVLDDIFDIQEKVAKSIAESLKIKLKASATQEIEKRKMDNSDAFEQYLFARHKIWQGTKESIELAINSLENNIKAIGNNDNLLVALGLAYFQYVNMGLDANNENLTKASKYIDEAISINPLSSKAYYVKGLIHETKGEVTKAFSAINKSLEININDAEALMLYAFLYGLVGHPELGLSHAEKAIENDPLNPWIYFGKWWNALSNGHLSHQKDIALEMYNIGEKTPPFMWHYGYSLALNNNFEQSLIVFDRLIKEHPDTVYASLARAFYLAITKENDEMIRIINELSAAAEGDHLFAWMFAQVCSYANEKIMAIKFMERSTRDIFINYPLFSEHDPFLENIRGEERFKELMQKVKYEWENFKV